MTADSLKLAIISLHKELKSMDRDQFNAYKKDLHGASLQSNEKLLELANQGLTTFWIIAHKIDSETFVTAVLDKEIPPVKLTRQEMELLKGGMAWEIFSGNFLELLSEQSATATGSRIVFLSLISEKLAS